MKKIPLHIFGSATITLKKHLLAELTVISSKSAEPFLLRALAVNKIEI
jgi:hypothetical protein